MKKTRFFLALLLTTHLSGCYLLNPKDKNEYLLSEANFNERNINHLLLRENSVYVEKKEKECVYYIFNNGYFFLTSTFNIDGKNCIKEFRLSDKIIKKSFCCWGRYRFRGDSIYLVRKNFYNINYRKGFIGSEYAKYTDEYKGVLTPNGINTIRMSKANPVIDSSAYAKRGMEYPTFGVSDLELTSLKYDLDTLLIKKLLKRD